MEADPREGQGGGEAEGRLAPASDAATPLIEHLKGEGASALAKYQAMFVGSTSLGALIAYEAVVAMLGPVPGGFGLALRKALLPHLLEGAGRNLLVGRNVTLRCPGRIRVGDNVTLDEGAVLDAKGSGPNARVRLGSDVLIGRNSILSGTDASIEFGDFVSMGPNCYLRTGSHITVGSNVSIGPYTAVIAGEHAFADLDTPILHQARLSRGITIGDGAWLGARVTVLDGVTIGANAVIGAGSLVREDVPPGAVAVGVPARVVRHRNVGTEREAAAEGPEVAGELPR
ncbi:MAG: acyltransferase [Gemmatimonadota bacterium]